MSDLKVRFGDYLREVAAQHVEVSYQDLAPKVTEKKSSKGPERLKLRPMDIYRLLSPYLSVRFSEQVKAVAPLAIYMGVFQWLVLNRSVSDASVIGAGLFAVILGLMLFMEGLKLGLMPFGEIIGNTLPRKAVLTVVLGVAFALGIGVTFAEPAIGALQAAGSIVNQDKAPLLFALLNDQSWALVLVVGLGVGIAAVLGTLRFIRDWSLKPLIYFSLIPTLLLTTFAHFHPMLSQIVGLAWDCGGVTTGPVTVPLVLSLGIGVAAAVGSGSTTLSGFGIVTLASVFPILGVLVLGIGLDVFGVGTGQVAAASQAAATWFDTTPGLEITMGLRAIIPLVIFLILVLKLLLKEKVSNPGIIRYGIVLSVLGMIVFNLGLTYGLAKLGDQAGGLVPGAFANIPAMVDSPLYSYGAGLVVAILFAFFLGFGATLAEPALNALGLTVENLTNGAFKKSLLMYAVSFGVGVGIAVGVSKIIFSLPLAFILVPGYAVALVLTYLSTEEFVNVAWDSAGVTTGPVTVPLVLAMGLGFGNALGAADGFGILAAASLFPILSVLSTGLFIQYRIKKRNMAEYGINGKGVKS